jgi:hypothetical protein
MRPAGWKDAADKHRMALVRRTAYRQRMPPQRHRDYSSVFTSLTSFVRLAFASPKSMLVFSS